MRKVGGKISLHKLVAQGKTPLRGAPADRFLSNRGSLHYSSRYNTYTEPTHDIPNRPYMMSRADTYLRAVRRSSLENDINTKLLYECSYSKVISLSRATLYRLGLRLLRGEDADEDACRVKSKGLGASGWFWLS